jgi:hypothetical protein
VLERYLPPAVDPPAARRGARRDRPAARRQWVAVMGKVMPQFPWPRRGGAINALAKEDSGRSRLTVRAPGGDAPE